jgi:hypothetical protein
MDSDQAALSGSVDCHSTYYVHPVEGNVDGFFDIVAWWILGLSWLSLHHAEAPDKQLGMS